MGSVPFRGNDPIHCGTLTYVRLQSDHMTHEKQYQGIGVSNLSGSLNISAWKVHTILGVTHALCHSAWVV